MEYDKDYYLKYGTEDTPYEWNPHYLINVKVFNEKWKPKRVLDVGCATGFYVKAWSDIGINAEGCDISEWAINNPYDFRIRNKLREGSVMNLPYPDNSFDLVMCFDVLEHLHEHDIPHAISELRRVSSNRIVITTLFKGFAYHEIMFKKDSTHKTLQPKSWWLKTMEVSKYGYEMKPYDISFEELGLMEFPLVDQMIITFKEARNE